MSPNDNDSKRPKPKMRTAEEIFQNNAEGQKKKFPMYHVPPGNDFGDDVRDDIDDDFDDYDVVDGDGDDDFHEDFNDYCDAFEFLMII